MRREYLVLAVIVMFVAAAGFAVEPWDVKRTLTGPNPNPDYRSVGGPDPFGYEFIDSNEAAGPTFSWIDISATGTNLALTDDSDSDLFNIGFTFSFYGNSYTQVNVGSNGVIYFTTDDYVGLENTCIPDTNSYVDVPIIALYWDDLVPSSTGSGSVYYELQGTAPDRQLVVMYDGVNRYGTSDPISFEAILNEDGSILMQYLDVDSGDPTVDAGLDATVGVEDYAQSSGYGLEYSCNEAVLSDSLAILFAPGTYEAPVPGIPTLNPWGLAGLLMAMAGVAVFLLRRQ